MSGISSTIGYIGTAKQTVKGTGTAQPTYKWPLAARPSFRPVKTRTRYVATDSSRDVDTAFTSQLLVQVAGHPYEEAPAMSGSRPRLGGLLAGLGDGTSVGECC